MCKRFGHNAPRPVGIRTLVLCVVGCVCQAAQGQPAAAPLTTAPAPSNGDSTTRPTFSPEAYLAHVAYLASDELGGRGIGTDGIRKTTEYIAGTFQRLGLKPAGTDGSYFHGFDMKAGATLGDDTTLKITGIDAQPKLLHDYVPFPFSSDKAFAGEVVFCGYGLVNAERQHDDFIHLDLAGKVVLVLRGEPPGWQEEGHFTAFASFQSKVSNARNRNAAAILIVNPKPEADQADELMPFRPGSNTSDFGLPALHIRRTLADAMLTAGGLETLDVLQTKLDAGQSCSAALNTIRVEGRPAIRWDRTDVRNVVAVLPGRGPNAEECVIIGAHHDHLGTQLPGQGPARGEPSDEPAIFNGADDNASGVAGVLELAAAFARRGPTRRTLVFMTFTAEESGLIGSRRFVADPTIPLDKTVAMLNLDMIGRMPEGRDCVQVFGVKSADEFDEILTECAEQVGIELNSAAAALGGSDHASFYVKGIPALHFYTGVHDDYHTPEDDTERINEQGAARILEFVYAVTEDLADRDAKPTYSTGGGASHPRSGFKVVMGLMPGFGESGTPGMEVAAVSPGRPADQAGIRGGDRIIRVNDATVNNVEDYMAALSGKRPGDKLTIVVQRGEERVTLEVILASGH